MALRPAAETLNSNNPQALHTPPRPASLPGSRPPDLPPAQIITMRTHEALNTDERITALIVLMKMVQRDQLNLGKNLTSKKSRLMSNRPVRGSQNRKTPGSQMCSFTHSLVLPRIEDPRKPRLSHCDAERVQNWFLFRSGRCPSSSRSSSVRRQALPAAQSRSCCAFKIKAPNGEAARGSASEEQPCSDRI